MGGMSAFTPGNTPELRAEQTRKVVEDKAFENSIGHDGCWVSHPYFIGPAMSAFPRANQLDVTPDIDDRPDLLPRPDGARTLEGLRKNVRVGIAYLHGWYRDIGCVAWDGLMEDTRHARDLARPGVAVAAPRDPPRGRIDRHPRARLPDLRR
jgi:malate synthase